MENKEIIKLLDQIITILKQIQKINWNTNTVFKWTVLLKEIGRIMNNEFNFTADDNFDGMLELRQATEAKIRELVKSFNANKDKQDLERLFKDVEELILNYESTNKKS